MCVVIKHFAFDRQPEWYLKQMLYSREKFIWIMLKVHRNETKWFANVVEFRMVYTWSISQWKRMNDYSMQFICVHSIVSKIIVLVQRRFINTHLIYSWIWNGNNNKSWSIMNRCIKQVYLNSFCCVCHTLNTKFVNEKK